MSTQAIPTVNVVAMKRYEFGVAIVADKLTGVVSMPRKREPKPKPIPPQEPTTTDATSWDLECSAEWHLAQLKGPGSNWVPLIYHHAFYVAKESGRYYAPAHMLAEYFKVGKAGERNIGKALHLLASSGFFKVVSKGGRGKPTTYKPIGHKEWETAHPGCCQKRVSMPWSDEPDGPGDALGRKLNAISGGKFKPFRGFVKGMLNTGHSEKEIVRHFTEFIEKANPADGWSNDGFAGRGDWNHGFAGRFIKYLRSKPRSTTELCTEKVNEVCTETVPEVCTETVPLVHDLSSRSSVPDTAVAADEPRDVHIEEDQSQKPRKTERAEKTRTEVQNPPPDRTPFHEQTQEEWEARKRLLKEQMAKLIAEEAEKAAAKAAKRKKPAAARAVAASNTHGVMVQ